MIYSENIQDVALITFYQKYIYFFVCFVLRADVCPSKVTTDFTLTSLTSNGHWLCRAVILCAVRKFGFLNYLCIL